MSNTSAYANILLTSPPLKASAAIPAVVTPKHDYVSDDSPTNFRQAFNDVHENQRHANSESSRHDMPRKLASAENPKAITETRIVKGDAEAGGTALQKKTVNQSAEMDRHSSGVSNQSLPKGCKKTEVVTEKLQSEYSPDVCEKDSNEVSQDVLALNVNSTSALNESALALLGAPVSASMTSAPATELVQSLSGADTAPTTIALSLSLAESSKETFALNAPSGSIDPKASLNSTDTLLGVEGQSLVNQVAVSVLEAQVAVADVPVLVAGAMPSLLPVKPAQGVISNEPEQAADILAVLTPETNLSEKLNTKATAPIDPTLDLTNPETITQVHMQTSKSAFEKALQSIVSPDVIGADDSAAPMLSSSSSSSSTNTLIDSLLRGVDQQTPAARSFVVQTAVPVPVGQPQWSQAVGEKVLWLAAQNVSSAEINLHPKDLGPLQVKVSVNQEQATVSFTSQHAAVREVLDQSLNRLRDMFSEQGLNLVNVDVSDKSFSRQQGDAQDQKAHGASNDVAQEEEMPIAMSAIVQQRLVDHYA